MDRPQSSRRAVLGGIGSSATVLLSGCETQWGEDPPEEAAEYDLEFRHPDAVRSDEAFDITIEGLPANTEVDVVLASEDGEGTAFEGRATIRTEDGTVSLTEATVVSESGDPPEGIVPEDVDTPLPVALVQFSAPLPINFYTYPDESTPTYRIETGDVVLGETTVTRRFPDVSAGIEPDNPELVGWVYEPVSAETGPGVLLLHGSGGSPMASTAALLAEHGYTAFALQYFGAEGVSDALSEVPLEYIETAAAWLREYETVSSDQIGAYGGSRGGELALLAASTFDVFGPVVSVSGSGVIFEGSSNVGATGTSTWTLNGEPFAYIPFGGLDSLERAEPAELQRATVPVENIDDQVLLLSGADDTLWPAAELQQIAADRLAEHGHPDFEHIVYEGTGHYFIEPYVPMIGATEEGGEVKGSAIASHDYWMKVRDTLSTVE